MQAPIVRQKELHISCVKPPEHEVTTFLEKCNKLLSEELFAVSNNSALQTIITWQSAKEDTGVEGTSFVAFDDCITQSTIARPGSLAVTFSRQRAGEKCWGHHAHHRREFSQGKLKIDLVLVSLCVPSNRTVPFQGNGDHSFGAQSPLRSNGQANKPTQRNIEPSRRRNRSRLSDWSQSNAEGCLGSSWRERYDLPYPPAADLHPRRSYYSLCEYIDTTDKYGSVSEIGIANQSFYAALYHARSERSQHTKLHCQTSQPKKVHVGTGLLLLLWLWRHSSRH